jgi:hypothetical protein
MAIQKHPDRVNELVRPKFGIPAILGQSDRVVEAFGPRLGFVLMVMAILAGAGVSAGMLLVARAVMHSLGWW